MTYPSWICLSLYHLNTVDFHDIAFPISPSFFRNSASVAAPRSVSWISISSWSPSWTKEILENILKNTSILWFVSIIWIYEFQLLGSRLSETYFGHKALENLNSWWILVSFLSHFNSSEPKKRLNMIESLVMHRFWSCRGLWISSALSFSVGFKGISPWFLTANLLDKTWDFPDACCQFQHKLASFWWIATSTRLYVIDVVVLVGVWLLFGWHPHFLVIISS